MPGQRHAAFVSYQYAADATNGAAQALRDLFVMLEPRGWRLSMLTGPARQAAADRPLDQLLSSRGHVPVTIGAEGFALHRATIGNAVTTVFEPLDGSRPGDVPPVRQAYPFLMLADRQLRRDPPDVIITFGGGWVQRALHGLFAAHGRPVVFWLRNMLYGSRDLFGGMHAIIVPSQFTADGYRQRLGIESIAIPSPVNAARVTVTEAQPTHLTFISPLPEKGVFLFARIASELARRRPEIPILVVIGRGQAAWLDSTGLTLGGLPNLTVIPPSDDPRQFFGKTRALLVPSLNEETFGRVAAEAMISGIPVLATRRGGLADTVGDGGFLFDVPVGYTGLTLRVPPVSVVEPWLETIIRLWDDSDFYAAARRRAIASAARFDGQSIATRHEAVLLDACAAARGEGAAGHDAGAALGAILASLQPPPPGLNDLPTEGQAGIDATAPLSPEAADALLDRLDRRPT